MSSYGISTWLPVPRLNRVTRVTAGPLRTKNAFFFCNFFVKACILSDPYVTSHNFDNLKRF